MTALIWRKFFKLPQTQALFLGTGLGYFCFLLVLGFRPISFVGGGLISVATIGAWAVEVRKEFNWMQNNLLDPEVFQARLQAIELKVNDGSNPLWQEAKGWMLDIQEFAHRIESREPHLIPELLETLYTTLVLTEKLVEKLAASNYIRTETYREIAQQQIQATHNRLQVTYNQLKNLHDQVVLLSSDRTTSSLETEIPAQLRLIIDANRIALQEKRTPN